MVLIVWPNLNGLFYYFILIVILLFPPKISSLNATLLEGKHLIVLPTQLKGYMETKVNSSGYVIEANGTVPEMLNWLSFRFRFNFSFVPSVITLVVDDTPTQRGKLSFLKNYFFNIIKSIKEADMVVGAIVMTHQRFQQADFPMPWFWTSLGAVVPAPETTTSLGNLFHPWKVQIWIGVVLALPIVILSLIFLSKWLRKMIKLNNKNPKDGGNITSDSIIKYVFGVFLSQGGNLGNNSMIIRLAAAAWCLACFILIQSYSCTLTSFLTVPQFSKPIIDSIYDVPKIKNLWIVTDRGLGTDFLLSNAESGVFKQFGTMLKNNPELRCNSSESCIDKVKSGSYVYVAAEPLLDLTIESVYKKDGLCHIMFLKERFLSSLIGFAIPKRSIYLEDFNRGFDEMMEYGLINYWAKKYGIPRKLMCRQQKDNRRPVSSVKSRLSINNLSGVFVLLLTGYLLSFVIFLIENVIHRCLKVN